MHLRQSVHRLTIGLTIGLTIRLTSDHHKRRSADRQIWQFRDFREIVIMTTPGKPLARSIGISVTDSHQQTIVTKRAICVMNPIG